MKHIEVVPYNHDWPKLFEHEAALIREALGDNCIEVHHIGSTSVTGLSAKPIIDIIAVTKIPEKTISSLEIYDFQYKGEYNIPMHFGFSKRKDVQVNLHVYEEGNSEIMLNVLFRDYLRAHPKACQEYAELKRSLLLEKSSYEKNNQMFTGYNRGKDVFIRKILELAGFNEIRIARCVHYQEWEDYHRICEEQIFKPINVIYDRNYPDFTADDHYYFVLYKGTKIVCVAHLQFLNEREAALRSLATDEPYKKQGFATHMMKLLERWVKQQGRGVLKMHAALRAEGFYRKLGYAEMEFVDQSISKEIIDLGKVLWY